jgi:uncharacterized membrane protein YccC
MVIVIVLTESVLGPAAGAVAVFGSLVSMWNPGGPLRRRLQRFALVGPLFPASMALGAMTSARPWLAIFVQALVILLVTTAYHQVMQGPGPGPLHLFYACSIGAYLGSIEEGTSGVLVTAAATAATAALTLLGPPVAKLLPSGPDRPELPAPQQSGDEDSPARRALPAPLAVGMRCAVAGLAAGLTAHALGMPHAYWAVLSATIVLHGGLDSPSTVARAWHRVLGTVFGVLLVAGAMTLHPSPSVQLAVASLAVWGMNVVMAWHYAAAATFITIMTLQANLLIGPADTSGSMLTERLLATFLGVAAALITLGVAHAIRSEPRGAPD